MKKLLVVMLLLSGISYAQQTRSIALSWGMSTTNGVTSYNVYRAPCNGTIAAGVCSLPGIFIVVGSTIAPALAYVDTDVTPGNSYVYYITAVCAAGSPCGTTIDLESAPSNQIAGFLPPPPSTPTGITIKVK